MTKRALTSHKYAEIYDFIVGFKQAYNGNSPTFRQIGDAVGISSSSVVNTYLDRMVTRGMIEREGRFRMISIPGSRWLPPIHLKVNAESEQGQKQEAKHMRKLLKVVRA
jgi:SOS-response transcriptional repressor LexA